MQEATPIKSHQHDFPAWADISKHTKDTNRHAKVDREKTTGPQSYTKIYRQLRNAESKRIVFSREENTNGLSRTMVSPENTSTGNIIQKGQVMLSDVHYLHIHLHVHVRVINKKVRHEFEREQEGVQWRLWVEQKEERNWIIILKILTIKKIKACTIPQFIFKKKEC